MKYLIEDDLNLYDLLKKKEEDEKQNENNVCLITGDELVDKYIKMECGHTFNYLPLYHDLRYHKYELNSSELSGKLCYNEIRCPYCRTKTFQLLPFYENMEIIPKLLVRPILGINVYYDGMENPESVRQLYKNEKIIQRRENKMIQKYFQKQFAMKEKQLQKEKENIQKEYEKAQKIKWKEESILLKKMLKEEETKKKLQLKEEKKKEKKEEKKQIMLK
jgi:hypothetical protein